MMSYARRTRLAVMFVLSATTGAIGQTIGNLPVASSVDPTDQIFCIQGSVGPGTGSTRSCTLGQISDMATSQSHIVVSQIGTPIVATGTGDCGTAPSIVGNDGVGRVTVGSNANGNQCTLTFVTAWTTAPVCSVQDETTATSVRPVVTTTTLAITGTLVAADQLSYRCVGF